MNPFTALTEGLKTMLVFLHDTIGQPLAGEFGWVWAIVLLTVAVRIVLLPLAVKQTKSMRAMQGLQPELKKIQKKYKADRGLAKSDPEKYREMKQKQQEATMALYKEQGVNPAASCLPLLLQMPIFFALYRVLQGGDALEALTGAPFYLGVESLATPASAAGIGAFVLIALMGISTFVSQRQMMARQMGATTEAQQTQQKVMLYGMPVMLTVFGFNLPVGVLVYWVTTNLWTMGQQYVIFRAAGATPAVEGAEEDEPPPAEKRPTPPAALSATPAGRGNESRASRKARSNAERARTRQRGSGGKAASTNATAGADKQRG